MEVAIIIIIIIKLPPIIIIIIIIIINLPPIIIIIIKLPPIIIIKLPPIIIIIIIKLPPRGRITNTVDSQNFRTFSFRWLASRMKKTLELKYKQCSHLNVHCLMKALGKAR